MGAEPGDEEDVERVIAAAEVSAARSPLYLWLHRNHAKLAAQFTGARVRWAAVATTLAELGVTDGNGAPPRPKTVRQVWWRVQRDVEKAQARANARRQPLMAGDAPSAAAAPAPLGPPKVQAAEPLGRDPASPAPAVEPMDGADESRPLRRFGVSKLPE